MISYSNWSVLSVNFMVVLYLALSGVALCSVLYLVGAKWQNEVRGLTTSLYSLFGVAFVLLLILLAGAYVPAIRSDPTPADERASFEAEAVFEATHEL